MKIIFCQQSKADGARRHATMVPNVDDVVGHLSDSGRQIVQSVRLQNDGRGVWGGSALLEGGRV